MTSIHFFNDRLEGQQLTKVNYILVFIFQSLKFICCLCFMNLCLMAFLKSFEEYKSINGEMITRTTSKAKALMNALKVRVSPLVPSSVSTLT